MLATPGAPKKENDEKFHYGRQNPFHSSDGYVTDFRTTRRAFIAQAVAALGGVRMNASYTALERHADRRVDGMTPPIGDLI
jgi:hypothetical protein